MTYNPTNPQKTVLIFGATGYLGQAACFAFANNRYSSYTIFALTRPGKSPEKLKPLTNMGIKILEADLTDVETCVQVVSNAVCSTPLDIIIDASGEFEGGRMEEVKKGAFGVAELVSKKIPFGNPRSRPIFLYTSGHWLHGDAQGGPISEEDNVAATAFPMVRWEVDHENNILGSKHLIGVILRPPYIYGLSKGSLRCNSRTWMWFAQACECIKKGGRMKVVGLENTLWPMVHVDDFANAYVLAARWALQGGWEQECGEQGERVFLVANAKAESLGDCMGAVMKTVGMGNTVNVESLGDCISTDMKTVGMGNRVNVESLGDCMGADMKTVGMGNRVNVVDWVMPGDEGSLGEWREFEGLEECLTGSCFVVIKKAADILQWKQKHIGFCEGVNEYFQEWKDYCDFDWKYQKWNVVK